MKNKSVLILMLAVVSKTLSAQEFSHIPYFGFNVGMINYEGDLKPNSFTLKNSSIHVSLFTRVPLTAKFSWEAGFGFGKVQAADRDNREYLQMRNLDFASSIKEFYTGIEFALLDLSHYRFTPYLTVGASVFHFNPYTYDSENHKVFLKPLGTEGQGLADYPDRKPYELTQFAFAWSGGIKYRLSEGINAGIVFSQRKTFTDYLDDVSASYVDYDKLFQARGQQAVDFAYRGDELPNSSPYPHEGEQRGTPTEKDWYYMLDLSVEFQLETIKASVGSIFGGRKGSYQQKCPSNF
jgi:hypothetical protein